MMNAKLLGVSAVCVLVALVYFNGSGDATEESMTLETFDSLSAEEEQLFMEHLRDICRREADGEDTEDCAATFCTYLPSDGAEDLDAEFACPASATETFTLSMVLRAAAADDYSTFQPWCFPDEDGEDEGECDMEAEDGGARRRLDVVRGRRLKCNKICKWSKKAYNEAKKLATGKARDVVRNIFSKAKSGTVNAYNNREKHAQNLVNTGADIIGHLVKNRPDQEVANFVKNSIFGTLKDIVQECQVNQAGGIQELFEGYMDQWKNNDLLDDVTYFTGVGVPGSPKAPCLESQHATVKLPSNLPQLSIDVPAVAGDLLDKAWCVKASLFNKMKSEGENLAQALADVNLKTSDLPRGLRGVVDYALRAAKGTKFTSKNRHICQRLKKDKTSDEWKQCQKKCKKSVTCEIKETSYVPIPDLPTDLGLARAANLAKYKICAKGVDFAFTFLTSLSMNVQVGTAFATGASAGVDIGIAFGCYEGRARIGIPVGYGIGFSGAFNAGGSPADFGSDTTWSLGWSAQGWGELEGHGMSLSLGASGTVYGANVGLEVTVDMELPSFQFGCTYKDWCLPHEKICKTAKVGSIEKKFCAGTDSVCGAIGLGSSYTGFKHMGLPFKCDGGGICGQYPNGYQASGGWEFAGLAVSVSGGATSEVGEVEIVGGIGVGYGGLAVELIL